MRQALITGGLGFIGSRIAHNLLGSCTVDHVVLVDDFGSSVSPIEEGASDPRRQRLIGIEDRCTVERARVQHFSVLADILPRYQPDYIFHLAGMSLASLQNSSAEEAADGSVLSTNNLLTACDLLAKRSGYRPQRFVYVSSSMVYGDFLYEPADEEHPLKPLNIYGTMKLAGEVCTLGLARAFGIDATVVRLSAVYGPTDMNRRVVQVFIERAVRGDALLVQGADVALDFTYVDDAAAGCTLAATRREAAGEIFNITAGQAHTLIACAELLKAHFPGLTYQVTEPEGLRPKRGALSIEKAKSLLGYHPAYSLQRGLDRYVAHIRGFSAATPLRSRSAQA